MTTSIPTPPETEPARDGAPPLDPVPPRTRIVETVFDNLSFWTAIAAAIGFLYLVWATFEILSRYVGHVPAVGP